MNYKPKKPYLYASLALFGGASASIIVFFFIYRYQGLGDMLNTVINILQPFVYGVIIAYLLKPSVNYFAKLFERKFSPKFKRAITPLSIGISFIIAGLSLYALFALILPDVIDSVTSLMVSLPGRMSDFRAWLTKIFEDEPLIQEYINTGYSAISSSVDSWVSNTLMPQASSIVSGVGLGVLSAVLAVKDLFIGLFVAIYLLAIRHKFSRQVTLLLYSVMRRDWADLVVTEVKYADRMFGGFINGKILDSIIIGFLCYFVCLIVGFPNPTLIAIIIGVTNVIPFFGPFIGAVPASILVLIVDPIMTIWFVIFILILQQFDGNILGPKILGDSTGLSSFWVLFSILFFGGLWGFPGMIVGVPLFAVMYDIVRQLILHGLARNGCNDMIHAYNAEFGTPHVPPMVKLSKFAAKAAKEAAEAADDISDAVKDEAEEIIDSVEEVFEKFKQIREEKDDDADDSNTETAATLDKDKKTDQ